MALKDLMSRGQTPEPVRPAPQAAIPAPPPPVAPAPKSAPTTYLGPATSFSGELRCSESLRIDGRIEGRVSCDHLVSIGESGSVRAAIEGDSVVVAGEVLGNITAVRKITLEGTARVTGDLCTPGIVIQEGAILEGRIMIGGDAPRAEAKAEAKTPVRSEVSRPANAALGPPPPSAMR